MGLAGGIFFAFFGLVHPDKSNILLSTTDEALTRRTNTSIRATLPIEDPPSLLQICEYDTSRTVLVTAIVCDNSARDNHGTPTFGAQ